MLLLYHIKSFDDHVINWYFSTVHTSTFEVRHSKHTFILIFTLFQTKPEYLTAACREALPKKAEKKEKKLSKEEKVKADRRKKIRNKAANMARGKEL